MHKMKILITGGDGQLGTALQQTLSEHALFPVDLPEVDITNRQFINDYILDVRPEIVIHCAAYTDVDGCARNPAFAYEVNALGTQNVALACQEAGSVLVHLSTNEIFAGNSFEGYEEWMPPDPINPYGHSKAAAETFVKALVPRFYIVRTAWLYAPGGRNFIHAILERARDTGQIKVVADEIGNPTYVRDLSEAIGKLINTGQFGIYHLVNEGPCSRWEFANEILNTAGLQDTLNQPMLSRQYKRASKPPLFGSLSNIAGTSIGITLRPWQDALNDFMTGHVLD
jgi:dTDP-4-dehydrorhamnose reductase